MVNKINLNKKYRLEEINKLACLIQDTKLKSIKEIRKIAETIEILSDDKILNGLSDAIKDFKKGRYYTLKEFKDK